MPGRPDVREAGPEAAAPTLTLSLSAGGRGAAARHGLSALDGRLDGVLLEHVGVMVDEFLAAAALGGPSADAPIGLRVAVAAGSVRAELWSHGAGSGWPACAGLDGIDGRGLCLVDRLADRWGVRAGRPLTIWFELDGRAPAPSEGRGRPVLQLVKLLTRRRAGRAGRGVRGGLGSPRARRWPKAQPSHAELVIT